MIAQVMPNNSLLLTKTAASKAQQQLTTRLHRQNSINILVVAIEKEDAAMSGTGKCATAVQRALAACGLPEFLGKGNGGEMDKPLLASGKFTQVSINDAKPGDIIVRPPSANPNDTSIYGDVSVITARNGDNITQTNDATYQFKKDNPRYDGKATFLRYTG